MQTAVSDLKDLLNRLPEESSYEDIQYHLYVFTKIQKLLASAKDEGSVPYNEIEKQFAYILS